MMIQKYICAFVFILFLKVVNAQEKVWDLQKCIDYAIENNLELEQSLLGINEADINISNAKGAYLPNLNASVRNTWNNGLSQNVTSGVLVKEIKTTRNSNYGLQSSIPIYNGLQNYHNLQQAKLQKVANQFNIDKIKDDIRINIANSYLQILLQRENVEILKSQYQLTLKQLKRTKELVDAGNLPKGEILQLEATAANDLTNISVAENSLQISKIGLKRLLNLNFSEAIKIKKEEVSLDELNVLETSVDDILSKVIENRNEVKLSELNVDIAKKGIDISKGAYLPTLSGFINFASRETNISKIDYLTQLEDNYGLTFGFSLNVPIFNRFQTRNSVARSKINVLKNENRLKQTKQRVSQNVYQAYLDAQGSHKIFQANEKAVMAQKQAFEYQKTKFDVGVTNALEFTQTKISYQNSQTELARAKYDLLFKFKLLELYYEVFSK